MLFDNETAGGIRAAFRLVGNWQKDATGDILITPFHGKQKSFVCLLAKEKYTFNAEKGILQAPPWLDARHRAASDPGRGREAVELNFYPLPSDRSAQAA